MSLTSFASLHPFVLFLYFSVWMGFTMLVNDPVNMSIAFLFSHGVYALCASKKDVYKQILYSVTIVIVVALSNPLFVHQGITILFYYNNNPITLEAFYYGLAFGTMLASVLTQCRVLHVVMSSDKILYLCSKYTPTIALILAMTLRLIPKFQRQAHTIVQTQKTVGYHLHQGSIAWRIRMVMMVFSMMITWAFEHGVESADSMKARGYGCCARTTYSQFRWTKRDTICSCMMLLLAMCMILGGITTFTHFYYYPHCSTLPMQGVAILSYSSFLVLSCVPMVMEGREYYIWHYVRVKK